MKNGEKLSERSTSLLRVVPHPLPLLLHASEVAYVDANVASAIYKSAYVYVDTLCMNTLMMAHMPNARGLPFLKGCVEEVCKASEA